MSTPTVHSRIQYSPANSTQTYVGTVIDTHNNTLTIAPIADDTGDTLEDAPAHNIHRSDSYRVLSR